MAWNMSSAITVRWIGPGTTEAMSDRRDPDDVLIEVAEYLRRALRRRQVGRDRKGDLSLADTREALEDALTQARAALFIKQDKRGPDDPGLHI